jgi:predicted ATPase
VVVLSGEAGIGKSRLAAALGERIVQEGNLRITIRCSPYHTNSALYPIMARLERLLQEFGEEHVAAKVERLELMLRPTGLPLDQVVPLIAALLSVPLPEGRYTPLRLSPQQQKQQTLEALVTWLLAEAARQPVLSIWEDLHWADPSTLELLELLLRQVPTARMLLVVICRPTFQPPWGVRSYLTPLVLSRLGQPQMEQLVAHVTAGKALPPEVLRQVIAGTDGVPLFVEECVKMILESSLVREENGQYVLNGPLPALAIPSTLQDTLMARLDHLASVKAVAQLGATVGREFTYELLAAVSPLDEAVLQHGLVQLVDAELLYQRGHLPQAQYIFKHALIQEAAYQSLLRSTRQQYHQRSAQVLETRFPETVESQPELLAQHLTEAGLYEQAVDYWRKAGQQASLRPAYREAIAHCSKGLELLQTLEETPARLQQELALQTVLGAAFFALRGHGSLEVEHAYTRAWQLCKQIEDFSQVVPVLQGLYRFYNVRAEYERAYELGEHLLTLAQRQQDLVLLQEAHRALGATLLWRGDVVAAHQHFEQGIALYNLQPSRFRVISQEADTNVNCFVYDAVALWTLGYPDQARAREHQGIELARAFATPLALAWALCWAARVSLGCREMQTVQEQAEAALALCKQHEIGNYVSQGMILKGWALIMQGQEAEHIALIRQGMNAAQGIGQVAQRRLYLTLLGEALGTVGQREEGLAALAEALVLMDKQDLFEAEAYRIQGTLLLQQAIPDAAKAEACFHQALAIARRQQAKSWELRTATSLSYLWQRQGKRTEARELLAPVYGWFTEGFDTTDLQEAKALLDTLA